MRNIFTVFKRELKGYFESPVAYVFMVAFLLLLGILTFFANRPGWYERNMADLAPFFMWHPWLYLLLVPAASMGLWAEERRSGTVELLLTMPITMSQAIIGKFLAAWVFIAFTIFLTFPIVITTGYLGDPDMGVIFAGYVGSILLAGACVAVGSLMSSLSSSQVIAFVLSFVVCFLLIAAGWPLVTDMFVKWAPVKLVEAVASFSFMTHYESIQRGVVDLRDIGYYVSVILFAGVATHVVLDSRRSA